MVTDYQLRPVRASSLPTTSYVAGTVIKGVELRNKLALLVTIDKQSATSFELIVEFSHTGESGTWFQQTSESVSAGTSTVSKKVYQFSTDGKHYIPPFDFLAAFIQISVKGTGTLTSTTVAVDAIIGRQ